MEYVSLKKIHYTQPDKEDITYLQRFNSEFSRHFGIDIKQYNHKKTYPAFMCYTEVRMLL